MTVERSVADTLVIHGAAELDSTSNEASRRLAAGDLPPFAVIAERQTAGRGRRGTSWESPRGNIYMTVILPAPPEGLSGALSLKAAALVAEALAAETGVRATLKWPNDLLFGGAKLGGLLLETSGDAVLIGLGLNVAVAPSLTDAAYPAVALASLLGGAADQRSLAERLARRLAAAWRETSPEAARAMFDAYAIESGQLWRARAGSTSRWSYRAIAGLRDDAALRLRSLDPAGSEEILTSVDHSYGWIYQGDGIEEEPLIVADLGNTSLKLARFDRAADMEPTRVAQVAWSKDDAALLRNLLAFGEGLATPSWPLLTLAVSREGEARLAGLAPRAGLALVPLRKRPLLYRGAYRLREIGADRLAAIEALLGLRLSARGGSASSSVRDRVVVAAGTATTIDAVGRDGRHLGGLILPGVGTALASLARATSLLPELTADTPGMLAAASSLSPGVDTESAMYQGAMHLTAGAIETFVRSSGFSPAETEVVVTGGYAPLVLAILRRRGDWAYGERSYGGLVHAPHLILQGARLMALGGARVPPRPS